MKIKQHLLLVVLLLSNFLVGQKGQVSGNILTVSGEKLPYAQVDFLEEQKILYCDKNGFFLSPKIP